MSVSEEFFDQPSGTREEILAATYHALHEHGYADLTIKRIGEVFEKSPSLVYRHYEGKDELVLACLEFMLDGFEQRMTDTDLEDPRRELEAFLAWTFEAEADDDGRRFLATLVELRSQASHDDAYREHFTRSDRVFERHLTSILEAGIERDVFRECDPARVATAIVTTLSGVMFRASTHEEPNAWLEDVRAELEAYLEARVFP